MKYYNISYPLPRLLQNSFVCDIWKRIMCKRGYHLLDEVDRIDAHYLYCDACTMSINILSVEESEE